MLLSGGNLSLLLSPDDEVFVAVAAAVFVVDDGEVVVAVTEVAEGCGADEVDRVVDLHVNQGLGEVVEGLRGLGHYDHDLSVTVAEGLAD